MDPEHQEAFNEGERSAKVDALKDRVDEISKDVKLLLTNVAQLNVKSGLWGALAGVVTSIAFYLMFVVKYMWEK